MMINLVLCDDEPDAKQFMLECREKFPDLTLQLIHCRDRRQLTTQLALLAAEERNSSAERFAVKTKQGIRYLTYEQILYCRPDQHTLHLRLLDGSEVVSLVLRIAFPRAVAPLLESGRFIQPHASYLINTAYIDCIRERTIRLYDGTVIPFPYKRQRALREAGWVLSKPVIK